MSTDSWKRRIIKMCPKSRKKKKETQQHGKTHGKTHGVTRGVTHGVTRGVTHGVTRGVTRGVRCGVTHGVTQHSATHPVTHGVPQAVSHRPFSSDSRISEDTWIYREGYPGKLDDLSKDKNWLFYSNSIPYEPNGIFIDDLHRHWADDYDTLERKHDYIQWLFPIRESGMNWRAQELQLHEAEKIKKNKKAKDRVLKSYRIMLGFYGIKSDNEGKLLKYADDWQERAAHLNRSRHNHLRITRILKSLGELGFEDLKKPFIDFILKEVLETKTLCYTFESCKNYWIQVLKNDEERNNCLSFFEKSPKRNQEKGSNKNPKRTTYV